MSYNLPHVSQCVCDAALREQTLVHDKLKGVCDTTHTLYSHVIHGFLHILRIVPQNYMDPLLVYSPTVQHPLDRLFHRLCRMRSAEVPSMQGTLQSAPPPLYSGPARSLGMALKKEIKFPPESKAP